MPIIADNNFKSSDGFGLYREKANPFAPNKSAVPEPVQQVRQPGALENEQTNMLWKTLEATDPGRYQVIKHPEFDAWHTDWEAKQPGFIEDAARQLIGGAYKGTGSAIRGVGEAVRALGDYTTTPLINAIFGTDARPSNVLDVPANAVARYGEKLQEGVSFATQEAITASSPDGDLLDPQTWTLGTNPSMEGYTALALDVFGQMLPIVAASVVTKSPMGGAVAGGAQGGGAAAEETAAIIDHMASQEGVLERESAYYRQLLSAGYDETEAVARTKAAATQAAFLMTAPISAFGGYATGAILNPATAILKGRSIATRIAGRAALSSVEEGVQEAAETFQTRQGVNVGAGTDIDPMVGTFADFLLGALAGGPVGAVGGALSGQEQAVEPEDLGPEEPPQPQNPIPAPSGPLSRAVEHGLQQSPILPATDALPPAEAVSEVVPAPTIQPDTQVMVNLEGMDPFPAIVKEEAEGEIVVQDQNGELLMVPRQALVMADTAPQPDTNITDIQQVAVEAAPKPSELLSTPFVPETTGTMFPDDNHQMLYELGQKVQSFRMNSTRNNPEVDRLLQDEIERVAEAMDIPTSKVREIADDYRYRVGREVNKANGEPITAPTVSDQMLDRARAKTSTGLKLDDAAQTAATSPENALPEPTQAQKEAGNYKLGHVRLGGMDISIENPEGSERKGTDGDGKPWSIEMKSHYGYFKGTIGRDKDHIDTFVKPGTDELSDDAKVYVIDQRNEKGGFDEHKVMIGFPTKAVARKAYLANYTAGWTGLGDITETTVAGLKEWFATGNTKNPFAPKWFGTQKKAEAYITKARLSATHHVVKAGKRFEVRKSNKTSNSELVKDTNKLPDPPHARAREAEEAKNPSLTSGPELEAEGSDQSESSAPAPFDAAKVLPAQIADFLRTHNAYDAIHDAAEASTSNKALMEAFQEHLGSVVAASGGERTMFTARKRTLLVLMPSADGTEAVNKTYQGKGLAEMLRKAVATENQSTSGVEAQMEHYTDLGIDSVLLTKPVAQAAKNEVLRRGALDGREHLIMLDEHGAVVANGSGGEAVLSLSPRTIELLLAPSNHIVAHHNHPASGTLSVSDVAMLRFPAMDIVYAHGHDGNSHRVSLTDAGRWLFNQLGDDPAGSGIEEVGRWIISNDAILNAAGTAALGSLPITEDAETVLSRFNIGMPVLQRRAMADAGIIEYWTELDAQGILEHESVRAAFDQTVEKYRDAIQNAPSLDNRSARPIRHPGEMEGVSSRAEHADGQSRKNRADASSTDRSGQSDRTAQPEAVEPPTQFAKNKLFTADKVEAARARLKSKIGQLNSGVDPEVLVDGMMIAGAYIEAGVRDFGDYAKAMTNDFGDAIKPFLLSFWEGARNYPGLDTDGMTNTAQSAAMFKALDDAEADTTTGQSPDTVPEPSPETDDGNVAELEEPSPSALEGISAGESSGTGESRKTGRGTVERGELDLFGDGSTRNTDVAPRSMGNSSGKTPVSTRRAADAAASIKPDARNDRSERSRPESAGGPELSGFRPTKDLLNGSTMSAGAIPVEYTITDADELGKGGQKTKYLNNINAIEVLRKLEEEDRAATRQEQSVLAKWVGWGGLRQAFRREDGSASTGWDKEVKELEALLTADELRAAESSTRNAHFTSPDIVDGIWKAVRRFGFTGGQMLEPALGSGNFLGLMPGALKQGTTITGVELDHITGNIAKNLYPQARISAPTGFEAFGVPDGHFDLVIGNPPFGSDRLYDPDRRHLNKFSIHNFFFAKSIEALKPNGVLAMVVTNRFLDGNDSAARTFIAQQADLIGAVRLPNNAFLKNAGTEVTTDLVFLRKRAEGEQANMDWVNTTQYRDKNGKTVPLNRYFKKNPDQMLGEFGAYGTMYGPDEPALIARDGDNLSKLLAKALGTLPRDFMDAPQRAVESEVIKVPDNVRDAEIGSAFVDNDTVYVRGADYLGDPRASTVEFPNEKAKDRVMGMVRVRNVFAKLRRAQLSETSSDKQVSGLRDRLNKLYDGFVRKHEPINADANKRLMRDDPSWPHLSALEDKFDRGITAAMAKRTGADPRPQSAQKAPIFTQRTQQPYRAPDSAKSAKDALSISLSEYGRIDMGRMAALYGKPVEAIEQELGDLLFKTPQGDHRTADDYLSGNVKAKLAEARTAAEANPAMRRNVEALEAVIPADIEPVDIDLKPGAAVVPAKYVAQFIDFLGDGNTAKAIYSPLTSKWQVNVGRQTEAGQTKWSTSRAQMQSIMDAVFNDRSITLYDRHSDGSSTLNTVDSEAANEKVSRAKTEWQRWLWEDDARREDIAAIYNDTFNTDVIRVFDGSHLTLPGKVGDDVIELRPNQKNLVWRSLQTGTVLADHVVGSGKTFALIASIMEKRRIGQAKKPLLTVPNHLVGQWAADFIKLYPGAKILAATKRDFEAGSRKRLFARIATGDWDAVIVAHSSFGRIGVSPEFEAEFINEQVRDLETSMTELRAEDGNSGRNIAQLSKWRDNLKTKLKKLLDAGGKDRGVTFDELGLDALYVDEAHEFKNLAFATSMQRVAGLGNAAGSQKAADLYMKVLNVLGRTGGKNVVFATGTPVSNTMAEMYTMQRYLFGERLKQLGLAHFDAWARLFGEVVTDFELSPSGQYKLNSRFAAFTNVPELLKQYISFADVITNSDIVAQLAAIGKKFPLPKVKGGKPQMIIVDRTTDQAEYIGEGVEDSRGDLQYPKGSLVHRAENLPSKPAKGEDNMLKVMSDARKAALDMRLIDPSYTDQPGTKLHAAAREIVRIHKKWKSDKGIQLVFIDLSTPSGAKAKEKAALDSLIAAADRGDQDAQEKLDRMGPDEFEALMANFSAYDDLKQKLVHRGIPATDIAFIHDAKTELQKEELFAKVRSGRIRILFGSTAKMGAGTNVQDRLVGLHHIDAPWRPSDLEQRDGRGIRQGNLLYAEDPDGFEIEILRYATKNTLDARQWQTIEVKARFIEQLRKGNIHDRRVEDIGGEASNAAEMKAAASGNPLILEEMDLRQKLRKIKNASAEHNRDQHRVKLQIRQIQSQLDTLTDRMPEIEADAASGAALNNGFTAVIAGETYTKPGEFGSALVTAARIALDNEQDTTDLGHIGDFTLSLELDLGERFGVIAVGKEEHYISIGAVVDASSTGTGMRVLNTLKALSDAPEHAKAKQTSMDQDLPKLREQLSEWGQEQELSDLAARHTAVLDQLRPKKKEAPAEDDTPDSAKASVKSPRIVDDARSGNPADMEALKDIIRAVGGLDNVEITDSLEVTDGTKEWGISGTVQVSGLYYPQADMIRLAYNSADEGTAYHEAFHRLQNLYMTGAERNILLDERGRLKRIIRSDKSRRQFVDAMSQDELEAEAFAIYSTGNSKIKPHKALQAIWNRLVDLIDRARRYFSGQGFTSAQQVFDRALSGDIAARSPKSTGRFQSTKTSLKLPSSVKVPAMSDIVGELKGKLTDLQPALLKLIPLNYFVELAEPSMTAVAEYMKIKRAMDAFRGTAHGEADILAQDWLKFIRSGGGMLNTKAGKTRAAALASLMHDATLAGVDPSKTDEANQTSSEYAGLRTRFMAMPPAGRKLFTNVRNAYSTQAHQLDKILLENIEKAQKYALLHAQEAYEADRARIQKSGLKGSDLKQALDDAAKAHFSALTRSKAAVRARMAMMRKVFENSRVMEPYFPLARHGRYFVSVKTPDGSVVSFSRREKSAERERLASQMRKAYPNATVETGVLDSAGTSVREAMDPRLVGEIETILTKSGVDGAVMDQIWQRYLESMPDLSTRKRFIHRKGTSGFDADALRSFSAHMFHASHQMARLKYGLDLQEMVNQTVKQAKVADDPTEAMTLANQLQKSHKWVMNPTGNAVAQKMTSMAFVWYLGTTPAAAMINMTQTPMMGIPILGAKFGSVIKAAAALGKASADSVAGRGSVSNSPRLSTEEKNALKAFYESGLIDRTQAHDLAGVGDTGVEYSPLRARVMAVISYMFHHAEVWNREVTALAAFRLARTSGQHFQDAVDTAHDLTWKTHFDYSNASRPALMQNDFAKVALVFRAHNINMLYRVFRDIHQAFKGDTPQAKKEARTQLAGILGMQALMAGTTGLFGFNTLMAIAGMVFGDDDDPMDFEQSFKKSVTDLLGPQLGGVVLKGVPGTYLGVDITNRIGMPDLWFRSPNRDLEGKEEYNYWVMNSLGASVSMIGDAWRGIDMIKGGDFKNGVQVMAPKFARDLMKAYRQLNEGLVSYGGDEILPASDFDPMDVIGQAIGFTPAQVSESWERNSALKNAEQRVLRNRRKLINRYALALRMGDKDGVRAALAGIRTFNGVALHRSVAITSDTLRRSMKARARISAKRQDGVLIQNEELGDALRKKLPAHLS